MPDTTTNVVAATKPGPTQGELLALGGAIGGGVGASIAIESGPIVGVAAVSVGVAGVAGLFASGIAGWELGKLIASVDVVQDSLQEVVEYIFPTNPLKNEIDIAWPEYSNEFELVDELGCHSILFPLGG